MLVLGGEQGGEGLGRDARAVVLDREQQIPRLLPAREGDGAALAGGLDAVEDGVFDQWLQGQLDDAAVVQCGGHLVLEGEGLHIAHALDGDVIVQQGQLLLQRDAVLGALGDIFEQIDQAAQHAGDAGAFLDHRHPADGIEGIIEEMRVDLALQQLDLDVLALLVHALGLLQQVLDAHAHLVDRVADLADLVPCALDGGVEGKIVGADPLDAGFQPLDRPGEIGREQKGQQKGQHQPGEEHHPHHIQRAQALLVEDVGLAGGVKGHPPGRERHALQPKPPGLGL